MEVQVTGSLVTVALAVLFAMGLTQYVKGLMDEHYHNLIPGPLVFVTTAVGVGLAWLHAPGFEQMTLVQGGSAGFVAGVLAAYGYDFVAGIFKFVRGPSGQ